MYNTVLLRINKKIKIKNEIVLTKLHILNEIYYVNIVNFENNDLLI